MDLESDKKDMEDGTMEVRRCEKGHFYDAEANSTCPQCAAERGSGELGGFAPAFEQGQAEDYGATEPMGELGATMPVSETGGFGSMDFAAGGMGVEDYEAVTQPVELGGEEGFTPVVGWLVCVDGPARGSDYRIHAGYNYMGRGEHMDICIRGDQKIGRDKHAMVAYDHEESIFFFGPADGKSIVRVNGKMVMTPVPLNAYDIISIGSTKLCFVPFCGERFKWNE